MGCKLILLAYLVSGLFGGFVRFGRFGRFGSFGRFGRLDRFGTFSRLVKPKLYYNYEGFRTETLFSSKKDEK